jgi:plastocyanin
MRKALWSAAALVALSGFAILMVGPAQAADTSVNMVDGPGDPTKVWKFEPAEITIPAGTKVTWKNTGDQAHTATADDGSFDSGNISNGGDFSQVIDKSVTYQCTPHPWMKGKITVSGATPTTASTPTTAAGGTTPTTAAAPGSTTTTTTAKAAAGGSTTTTTAGGGVTSTTQAPSVTPTSAPETGGVTTTTAAAAGGGEEAAGGGHGSEEPKGKANDKSSPIGIAFAAVSTLLLLGISGKLLASKS